MFILKYRRYYEEGQASFDTIQEAEEHADGMLEFDAGFPISITKDDRIVIAYIFKNLRVEKQDFSHLFTDL